MSPDKLNFHRRGRFMDNLVVISKVILKFIQLTGFDGSHQAAAKEINRQIAKAKELKQELPDNPKPGQDPGRHFYYNDYVFIVNNRNVVVHMYSR